MIMYYYRLTKYDPKYRDQWGAYQREEWTGPRSIGKVVGGHVLTEDEYLETENRYLYAFEAFAHDSGITRLTVHDPSVASDAKGWEYLTDGATITLEQAVDVVRAMLRQSEVKAQLAVEFQFFVHVGADMYMYLGSHTDCARAAAEAERIGLFVDRDFVSPYLPEPDEKRYWWLPDGVPVKHDLYQYDLDNGAIIESWPLSGGQMVLLRPLFELNEGDELFYDTYDVEDDIRSAVAEIAGRPLDPAHGYRIRTIADRPS